MGFRLGCLVPIYMYSIIYVLVKTNPDYWRAMK